MQHKKDCSFMPVRILPDVKDWLRRKAERNLGSMSAEAVRTLRDAMDAELRAAG